MSVSLQLLLLLLVLLNLLSLTPLATADAAATTPTATQLWSISSTGTDSGQFSLKYNLLYYKAGTTLNVLNLTTGAVYRTLPSAVLQYLVSDELDSLFVNEDNGIIQRRKLCDPLQPVVWSKYLGASYYDAGFGFANSKVDPPTFTFINLHSNSRCIIELNANTGAQIRQSVKMTTADIYHGPRFVDGENTGDGDGRLCVATWGKDSGGVEGVLHVVNARTLAIINTHDANQASGERHSAQPCVFDVRNKQIYYTTVTRNNFRPVDAGNNFLIALDLDTGAYRWNFSRVSKTGFDYAVKLYDAESVLLTVDNTGYLLSAATGALLGTFTGLGIPSSWDPTNKYLYAQTASGTTKCLDLSSVGTAAPFCTLASAVPGALSLARGGLLTTGCTCAARRLYKVPGPRSPTISSSEFASIPLDVGAVYLYSSATAGGRWMVTAGHEAATTGYDPPIVLIDMRTMRKVATLSVPGWGRWKGAVAGTKAVDDPSSTSFYFVLFSIQDSNKIQFVKLKVTPGTTTAAFDIATAVDLPKVTLPSTRILTNLAAAFTYTDTSDGVDYLVAISQSAGSVLAKYKQDPSDSFATPLEIFEFPASSGFGLACSGDARASARLGGPTSRFGVMITYHTSISWLCKFDFGSVAKSQNMSLVFYTNTAAAAEWNDTLLVSISTTIDGRYFLVGKRNAAAGGPSGDWIVKYDAFDPATNGRNVSRISAVVSAQLTNAGVSSNPTSIMGCLEPAGAAGLIAFIKTEGNKISLFLVDPTTMEIGSTASANAGDFSPAPSQIAAEAVAQYIDGDTGDARWFAGVGSQTNPASTAGAVLYFNSSKTGVPAIVAPEIAPGEDQECTAPRTTTTTGPSTTSTTSTTALSTTTSTTAATSATTSTTTTTTTTSPPPSTTTTVTSTSSSSSTTTTSTPPSTTITTATTSPSSTATSLTTSPTNSVMTTTITQQPQQSTQPNFSTTATTNTTTAAAVSSTGTTTTTLLDTTSTTTTTTNTTTTSTAMPVEEAKSRPSLPLPFSQEAAAAVATFIGSAAGLSGSAAGGVLLGRSSQIARTATCGEAGGGPKGLPRDETDPASSPLQLLIGEHQEDGLSSQRGLLWGNAIFLAGFVLLHAIFTCIYSRIARSDDTLQPLEFWSQAAVNTRFPSLVLVPGSLLAPASASAITAVALFSELTALDVASIIVGGFIANFSCMVYVGWVVYTARKTGQRLENEVERLRREAEEAEAVDEDDDDDEDEENDQNQQSSSIFKSLLPGSNRNNRRRNSRRISTASSNANFTKQLTAAGVVVQQTVKTGISAAWEFLRGSSQDWAQNEFMGRHGNVIDAYNVSYFALIELVTSFAVGFGDGLVFGETSQTSRCFVSAGICIGSMLIYAAFIVLKRPFLCRFDFLIGSAGCAAALLLGFLSVTQLVDDESREHLETPIEIVSVVLLVISFVACFVIVDVIAAAVEAWRRAKRNRALAKAEKKREQQPQPQKSQTRLSSPSSSPRAAPGKRRGEAAAFDDRDAMEMLSLPRSPSSPPLKSNRAAAATTTSLRSASPTASSAAARPRHQNHPQQSPAVQFSTRSSSISSTKHHRLLDSYGRHVNPDAPFNQLMRTMQQQQQERSASNKSSRSSSPRRVATKKQQTQEQPQQKQQQKSNDRRNLSVNDFVRMFHEQAQSQREHIVLQQKQQSVQTNRAKTTSTNRRDHLRTDLI